MAALTTITALGAVSATALTGASVLPLDDANGITKKASLQQIRGATGVYLAEDHGAAGDGATLDTDALNAAITAAHAAGGGVVHGTPGRTYRVDGDFNNGAAVRLRSGVHLDFHGATLQVASATATITAGLYGAGVTDVSIRDVRIVGDRATHSGASTEFGAGVHLLTSSRVTLKDVRVEDCEGDGFYFGFQTSPTAGQECTDVKLTRCTADNCRRTGLAAIALKRFQITDCTFTGTNGAAPEAGIDMEPDVGSAIVQDGTIKGCTFADSAYGVVFGGAAGHETQQVIVSGNTFRNHRKESIYVGAATIDGEANDNTIVATAAGYAAIHLAFCQGATVEGNTVRGTFLYGVWNQGAGVDATAGKNTVSGNLITGDGTPTYGIRTENHAGRSAITDNEIGGCVNGVGHFNSDWSTITGNRVRDVSALGYDLEVNAHCDIADNIVDGAGTYGFFLNQLSLCLLDGLIADLSQYHGVYLLDSPDCVVTGIIATSNSQNANATYDNIIVAGDCSRTVVRACKARAGALTNKPRAGLAVTGTSVGLTVDVTGLTGGGATWDYRDLSSPLALVVADPRRGQVSGARGDADVTLTAADVEIQNITASLTADRTFTLPAITASLWPGFAFAFTRVGGAFNLLVKNSGGSTIATLAANAQGRVCVDAAVAAWVLVP